MANDEHIAILKKGVDAWNAWRNENPDLRPDLRSANLSASNLMRVNFTGANLRDATLSGADLRACLDGADLTGARLSGTNLDGANLIEANLERAILNGANLIGANLRGANLYEADLNRANLYAADLYRAYLSKANLYAADLQEANLRRADLVGTNLSMAKLSRAYLIGANLTSADLRGAKLNSAILQAAMLIGTDFSGADLTGCRIHGISAWRLKLDRTQQENLIITQGSEPTITVDNIEVAQFIYLMLNNQKVRDVIDSITSKAVLILGRFTDDRKAVLDALRAELRNRNYLPILFDFDVPASRDISETISLLARMARFVVADITDAKSIPQELGVIVPDLPSVPVQPLLLESSAEYAMFEHFKRYPWVLEAYRYPSPELLIANLAERVIGPAEDYARSARGAAPPRALG